MRRGRVFDRLLLALLVAGMVWEGGRGIAHIAQSEWGEAASRLIFAVVLLAVAIGAYRLLLRDERGSKTEN